jgi:hypothetical protein
MKESAERNDDYNAVRGAPTTKPELWNLANDLGRNPDEMDLGALERHMEGLLGGMKDMAQSVLAARQMLKASATNVANRIQQAINSGSVEDKWNVAQAIARHDTIQSAVSGATASWGRTGSAFHDISGLDWGDLDKVNSLLKQNTGRTLFQIDQFIKLASQYDSTKQISNFVKNSGYKPWRMLVEYWINGLISGIQTHITYGLSNTALAIQKMGPETAIAAGIGALRGREGERVRIGEVGAGFSAAARGFWPAVQSAIQAAETGVTGLLPNEVASRRFGALLTPGTELVKPAPLNEAATIHDVMATTFGIVRGVREGIVAGAKLQAAGGLPGAPLFGWSLSPLGAIPNFQVRGVTTVPVGDIIRAPSRMIAAVHSFFRSMNYLVEINQQGYRAAANKGLEGAEFANEVARVRQSEDAIKKGHDVANELTLMSAGHEFTRRLSLLVNTEFFGTKDASGNTIAGTGLPILKFIDPFVHISSNIINQSIVQRSPVGLLSPTLRANLLGHNGPVAADTAAARMLAGTALSLLFGGLAAEGYITGSEPHNRQEAAIWRQVYQAHSVRIGDTWYAMNRLGPMGMLLSTAADLYDMAHHASSGEFAKAAAALQHAVTQNILDESFMRGPSDLIKAIEDPKRYGDAYIRNFASSFVPFSVSMQQMARAADPYARDARTITDAMKAHVPGLSQQLMPRIGVWGEPVPSREGLGGNITAIWEQAVNNDPVNIALKNLSIYPAAVGRKVRNVELTPEQHDQYARIAGRLAKQNLDRIVLSPSFQSMPNPIKHDLITEALRQSRTVAEGMLFMKNPHILSDAYKFKMQKRQGPQ